jgi:hypothetical protein
MGEFDVSVEETAVFSKKATRKGEKPAGFS